MLHLNKSQKQQLDKVHNSTQGKWSPKSAEEAIKIIYGNKASLVKFVGKFKGNMTRTIMKCNMCGKIRKVTLKSVLYNPTCPQCDFKHHINKLSYSIIQERLVKKHRPIVIIPFTNHPYKNNNTKFMAYDYKHNETWVTCAGRLSEGKGAPNYHHKKGFQKKNLHYYMKKIKAMYKGQAHVSLVGHYNGDKTIIQITNDVNHIKNTTTMTNLIKNSKYLSLELKAKSLPYYLKLIKKLFHNELKLTHISKFNGKYTHIKGVYLSTHKTFNTTFYVLLLNTDFATLSKSQLHIIHYFNKKYGKKNRHFESQLSRARFGYEYNHQHNIYIPHIKYVMKHYNANVKFRAFGLKDNYGHNPRHPWLTRPYYVKQSWNTPSANRKLGYAKKLNVGLKSFEHWYKNQDRITIPKFNRIVRHYSGTKMTIHCICNNCGYGKYGEWTEKINKLISGVKCPKCLHVVPIPTKKVSQLVKKLYHNAVTISFPKDIGTTIKRYQKVLASNYKNHKTWHATVHHLLVGHGYIPEVISKSETAINKVLEKLGFTKQVSDSKLPTNNHYVYGYLFSHNLYADFVLNINGHYIIIECNEKQHFNIPKNKDGFSIIRIQDHKNLNKMKDIKKLVNKTLDKKLVPLIHKYSNGHQQLGLF